MLCRAENLSRSVLTWSDLSMPTIVVDTLLVEKYPLSFPKFSAAVGLVASRPSWDSQEITMEGGIFDPVGDWDKIIG